MNLIIVDFEANCSDTDEFPREEMEIIEIGACGLDKDFNTVSEFQAFIKPVRHPVLTKFCKELTTITQDQVEQAESFADVIQKFKTWIDSYENPVFSSWGGYDKNQLKRDCEFHDVSFPFSDDHINLKKEFSKFKNSNKRYGVGQALKASGLKFEGTPHRGIDDANNIARLARLIMKKHPNAE